MKKRARRKRIATPLSADRVYTREQVAQAMGISINAVVSRFDDCAYREGSRWFFSGELIAAKVKRLAEAEAAIH